MQHPTPVLALLAEADHARLAPGEQRLFVVIDLEAGDAPVERERPALVTVLAVDVSGSMRGEPLDQVVRSVERIMGLLEAGDQLGVVAFSTGATEVAPVAQLDAGHRRAITARVARMKADDRTNIEAGLRLARSSLPPKRGGARRCVVLLSDGEPNVGASTPGDLAALSREIRPEAVVSTLGYGTRHDDSVLSAIAEGGGGAYRFVPDPTVCQLELAQAVGAQGDVAVESIELHLRPKPGVEVLSVLGSPAPRYGAEGLVLRVPDMLARGRRIFAVELRAQLDESRVRGDLLEVSLQYCHAGETSRREATATASVDIGSSPAESPRVRGKVLLLRADGARAEARAMAERGQFEAAAAMLRGLIREMDALGAGELAEGSPLSEAREQLLDEAMAMERKPAAETLAGFRMSTAPRSFAAGDVSASSRSKSVTAARFASTTAGLFPEAYLRVVSGPDAGREVRLAAQNTIGRTTSADVVIPSDSVSRRHADVFALEGEFWIVDLCSTNTTKLNDRALTTKPARLRAGDRIQVGEAVLTYREVTP